MTYERYRTRTIHIGDKSIGGNNPILIQSMTNTKTSDIKATIAQIEALADEGCEIVRVAVNDQKAAEAIKEIKKSIKIPLVADIHFDYRLAVKAIENGIDKIRINPGNIGSLERVKAVVNKAKENHVPIRVGVNSGSLEKELLEKYGKVTPEAMVESALNQVKIIEDLDYDNIVISLKSSSVPLTIKAHELIAEKSDYPIHLGITESGTVYSGSIKSAAGIGAVLSRGIGDTIRVSLTDDPVEEIICAKELLKALEIRKFGVNFISCPTCGRTEIDLIALAKEVEGRLKNINKDITVAVMGCVVNGPGEAKDADIGIAGGKGCGVIFKHGEILKKLPEEELADALIDEINKL